jgi:lysyl endopeptidase
MYTFAVAMFRSIFFALILLPLLGNAVSARQAEPPLSWSLSGLQDVDKIPTLALQPILADALMAEDAAEKDGQGLRYAVPFAVAVSPERDGHWELLPSGDRLWRLRIEVPGATDINLGFTRYELPRGATLHLWSIADRYHEGPYLARDNKRHGQLWTPPVPGDSVVVELLVPADAVVKPILELTQVSAGYRDLFGRAGGPFLKSHGSCNIDVICPEGDAWRDQIRSVATYSRGGGRLCTGSLIMDVPGSFTPFFLTANHCGMTAANAPSLVVFWNFESPVCGMRDGGSLADNQTGSTLRASRNDVDMALLELDDEPDEAFNVHYSGWDRTGTTPPGAVGIHHPRTHVKSISFANSALTSQASCIGGPGTPDTHWRVPFWNDGTTEPGSSGSGIWHPLSGRLVGFLSGGAASCTVIDFDCYGKFSVAWDGASAAARMRDWLDPASLNPDGVDGSDPFGFTLTSDVPRVDVCLPGDAQFNLDLDASGGFDEAVTLSTDGLPGGVTSGFSANPVTPPGSSTLTLNDLDQPVPGVYDFTVEGVATSASRTLPLSVGIFDAAPASPSLSAPADGATGVATSPTLSWAATAGAAQYQVDVASDAGFVDIVYSATTDATSHGVVATLSPATGYFWRVTALNPCGTGAASATFAFTTAEEICLAPNVAIPDNNPAGVSSTANVALPGNLLDLRVYLDITHTYVGDLIIDLQHMDSSTTVRLVNRPGLPAQGSFGCSGNDMDLTLDDAATLSIQDDCTAGPNPTQAYQIGGEYFPNAPLAGFAGLPATGDWRLTVSDNAGADTGTLNAWCLLPSVEVDLPEEIFADGFES